MVSAKNSQVALARRAAGIIWQPRAAVVIGDSPIGSTHSVHLLRLDHPHSLAGLFAARSLLYGSSKLPHNRISESMRLLKIYSHGIHSLPAAHASASPAFAAEPMESDEGPQQADEGVEIAKLSISQALINGLAKRGITSLFPIQKAVLEPTMKGQDLIARAKTGTGKTLAFGIPILDKVLKENEKRMRGYGRAPLGIVLAPTRELAKQVETEMKESAPTTEVVCVYGGVSIDGQCRQIQRGVDVVVGTPGRVIDLLDRGALNLKEVQFFVLDEADRMLAVGFAEDVEKVLQHLPAQRQSLLFSATMPDWVKRLAGKYLRNHIVVDLVGDNDEKLAEGIKLLSISTTMGTRRFMLNDLITVYGKGCKSIVFTQTKKEADDVSFFLGAKLGCEALHGDISQHQREKTLKSFRDGRLSVLVATDVAARGLDISNVDLVVHYELANDTETFVHRSGRTGRAGKQGTAILMYMDQQRRTLDSLERELGCKFESIDPPTLEEVLASSSHLALNKMQGIASNTRDKFLAVAEKLISEQGPSALAAAIACLCGCTEVPTTRSLISYDQGLMTLQITRPGGLPIATAQSVSQFVGQVLPAAASSIGQIRMLSESQVPGAIFDLPEKMAKELLSMSISTGEVLEAPKKLPKIVEDTFRFGGGFGQRGFSPRGPGRFSSGGFSGGSGSYSGSNWSNRSSYDSSSRPSYGSSNWSNRSTSGADSSWSSRPSSGYGSGSSGFNSSSGGYGSGSSGFNSSSGGYGSSTGSGNASGTSGSGTSTGTRSSIFSNSESLFTTCLRCGSPDHRIANCPVKWNAPR